MKTSGKIVKKLATKRYGINTSTIGSNSHWLCKKKQPKQLDKDCYYKMMLNCFRDGEIVWKQNSRSHPLCFACDHLENWEHLFSDCIEMMEFLGEVGVKNIKDVFSKVDVKKVKTTVQITLGSLTENKPRKINFLQKLTHALDIYSCSNLTGHMR